jgi:hypothetical protein
MNSDTLPTNNIAQNLPPEVQSSISIDQKQYQEQVTTIPQSPAKFTTKILQPFKQKQSGKKSIFNFFKTSTGCFALVALMMGCFVLMLVTNIDTVFIKVSLYGKITDSTTSQPIANAEIKIKGNIVAKTNNIGEYRINGLNLGKETITISAVGYNDLVEEVPINRVLLNYSTKRDFQLSLSETAILVGKFVNAGNNTFSNDLLEIGSKQIVINDDGSFRVENIILGDHDFIYKSDNFKDINIKINIKNGINQLKDIEPKEAADIEGSLISYIREELVTDIKFSVENITEDKISIDDDGFQISDLDINKEYRVLVEAPGYLTRTYTLTTKQGVNIIADFKLVEDGVFAYFITQDRNFYKADFDGENIQNLYKLENASYRYEYLNPSDNRLYFLSEKDRLRGAQIGSPFIVYSLGMDGDIIQITQNISDINILYPNYRANKMVNSFQVRNNTTRTSTNKITLMTLDGNNRVDIKESTNKFSQILISDDGRFVFYAEGDEENPTLYRFDVEKRESQKIVQGDELKVFDISGDGKLILYSRKNSTTNFTDLFLYNIDNNENRVIDENLDGEQYQFYKNSNTQFIYFSERAGRSNIYKYDLTQNKDERITNLSAGDQIENLFELGDFVVYHTQKGFYIIDLNIPKNYKQIVLGDFPYTALDR